jgi:hypothetical protein
VEVGEGKAGGGEDEWRKKEGMWHDRVTQFFKCKAIYFCKNIILYF